MLHGVKFLSNPEITVDGFHVSARQCKKLLCKCNGLGHDITSGAINPSLVWKVVEGDLEQVTSWSVS